MKGGLLLRRLFADWKIYPGLIIQDSGNDLNVYHNEATDSSCENLSTQDTNSAKQGKGCCGAETGCNSTESGLADAVDIDFNEWTGKQSAPIASISMA